MIPLGGVGDKKSDSSRNLTRTNKQYTILAKQDAVNYNRSLLCFRATAKKHQLFHSGLNCSSNVYTAQSKVPDEYTCTRCGIACGHRQGLQLHAISAHAALTVPYDLLVITTYPSLQSVA